MSNVILSSNVDGEAMWRLDALRGVIKFILVLYEAGKYVNMRSGEN